MPLISLCHFFIKELHKPVSYHMYMYIYKDYKINTLKIIFKNSMSIIEILENGDFLKIY